AQEIGITNYNFGVLPQTKAEILSNFNALGKKAVMIGDGFNDIIALLRADASVVFSSGKNVYNNWVDVILKRSDLGAITDLFRMNKKLSACIYTNVVLCVLCNMALVGSLLFIPAPVVQVLFFVPAGLLIGVAVIFLNSARLLNIK
ncbi:MAG: cation-translocating P-type ATPase, partial [Elusimicrobiaceae bacterium]|nr:cation-translocating P-type ATPase [Elusimicrobiaceae bacterium]